MSDQKPKIDIDQNIIDDAMNAIADQDGKTNLQNMASAEVQEQHETKPQEPTKEELRDRWIRVTADFENFRKRAQKEKADLIRFGNENLVKELLPILDNFERAFSSTTQPNDSFFQGVQLIYSQLKTMLERFGVTSDSALGKTFDPHLHDAMNFETSDDHPPHTVIHEHQKMYFLNKKLIRPALVTVSKEKGDASSEAPTVELDPSKFNS